MAQFTVDTHLFRELGALLVGRDSTALIELIKNAYDADAKRVIVSGTNIGEHGRGVIVIDDDGHGMTEGEFETGFLRVASRTKEIGERRSPDFQRRYTGAKGIGRLAAHKLARQIEIASAPSRNGRLNRREELVATIDWDRIEQFETLDQIEGTDAIQVGTRPRGTNKPGTIITLRRLRRRWTSAEHGRFLEEVQTFQPPSILADALPKGILAKPLLFQEPRVRDSSQRDPGFHVELSGELAPPDAYWQAVVDAADWVIEIDASRDAIRYGVAPTRKLQRELPHAESRTYETTPADSAHAPSFMARILMRTGAAPGPRNQREWLGRISGVRVYMEGFRVLPYGDGRSDWLSLNRDVVERSRSVIDRATTLAAIDDEQADQNIGLHQLPEKHFFGAVFLLTNEARGLEMLINREGFLPNASFDALVSAIRGGIHLATRAHASATAPRRDERRRTRESTTDDAEVHGSAALGALVSEANVLITTARTLSERGQIMDTGPHISAAAVKLQELAVQTRSFSEEAAMMRVLASLGAQLASFVHELNAVLAMAQGVEAALNALRSEEGDKRKRQRLGEIVKAVGDLRRQIEKQASFLVDVVTPDARRRRRRLPIGQVFDSAARLVAEQAARQQIEIRNNIADDLKTPPMFPAEATMLFSNLLTNAVKAAGPNGKIYAHGRLAKDGRTVVRIENTGIEVDPADGERWFRPFESASAVSDPQLGYGMGLGLPITRSMLEEYGAEVSFVRPQARYATAVEVVFPRS